MPIKITLHVTSGELKGKTFVFDERTTCIIGRDEECFPRLPSDKAHSTISRTHCLLDINPPDIRIRDFGSLNGTYVNGKKIGQRESGIDRDDAIKANYPEYDLHCGDEIRLGETVFKVDICIPVRCNDCSCEISEKNRIKCERLPGFFQCDECYGKSNAQKIRIPPKNKPRICAECGKDVSNEVGIRDGEYVCHSCQADPMRFLKRLLERAGKGDQALLSVKGYSIIKEIGRGGMGIVCLARQESTGAHVALKAMLPRVAADEHARQMFLRETENIKTLRHTNVVRMLDSGFSNGSFFFTLDFCDGGSVDKLMEDRGGRLSVDEALPIIFQALDGLNYAHHANVPQVKLVDGSYGKGCGLVHRDIKPANILLCGTGKSMVAKIADFGLAKAFDQAGLSGQTATGAAAGSPWFMPRQQVVNFKYSKPDVDVWAMAASLYNMLTGASIFPRNFEKGKDVWQTVLQTNAIPILSRGVSLPFRLAKVIDEALVDKPGIRFKSALELKRALQEAH